MGPNIKTVEQKNAATPLSDDFIKILQGQLDEGAFGTGVGPLQREAGTNARQFVNSLRDEAKVDTASKVGDYTGNLIRSTSDISKRNLDRSAADLREAFGAAGSRYGSSLATGEGRLRADANMDLDQVIASILTSQGDREQSARQFDVNANQNKNAQFINALNQLFGMGEANIAPYLAFADRGLLNPETVVSPGLGSQFLSGLFSLGSSYIKGGGDINPFNNGNSNNSGSVDSFNTMKPFTMPRIGGGSIGEPSIYNNGPVYNPGSSWDQILGRRL